ncbi:MAG: metallophosphoesterase [Clostridia bacterium]|nr:metallophosphoesterase [Clostridia bacterium]
MKRIGLISVIICLLAVAALGLSACKINPDTPIQEFSVDKDYIRVGIISDSQLPNTREENEYQNNLIRALSAFKARGVDMIMFGGDITDLSKSKAYDLYTAAYDRVFGNDRPIVQTIMGNHDYWGHGVASSCRRIFTKKVGHGPWTHYVVNGYHFIGASPDSGSMDNGYKKVADWLRGEIEKAVADDADKPVFVMTHNGARGTAYGTEEWGDYSLDDIFKDYPQVVNFSGHSHYSLLDERSIHQRDYTSIATQSVSYTELETGKVNGTIPPNASATPMGYVMDVHTDKVEIIRVNFSTAFGEEGLVEKQPWVLPIPLTRDGFVYTYARASVNSAPEMSSSEGVCRVDGGSAYLEFDAGMDDDFVHSYKLVWSDGLEQLYFSDFYNGLTTMSRKVSLAISRKAGTYGVKIYAVDSWGAVSAGYTEIKDVTIS